MLNNIAAIVGGAAPEVGDYESIATTTVGSGGAATVTFSSIVGTYKHLQLRVFYAPFTSSNGDIKMQFNSDSGANYSRHGLNGNGTSASAYASVSDTFIGCGYVVTVAGGGSVSTVVMDILDYSNTSKYKTTRALDGRDRNGAGDVSFSSGSWRNTAAITSLVFTPPSGNFPQYSTFALYGIK